MFSCVIFQSHILYIYCLSSTLCFPINSGICESNAGDRTVCSRPRWGCTDRVITSSACCPAAWCFLLLCDLFAPSPRNFRECDQLKVLHPLSHEYLSSAFVPVEFHPSTLSFLDALSNLPLQLRFCSWSPKVLVMCPSADFVLLSHLSHLGKW